MDMSQHPASSARLTVPITKPQSAEEAIEKREFWITMLFTIALIAIWAGATAIFGLIGFILFAVGLVPVAFLLLIRLTLG